MSLDSRSSVIVLGVSKIPQCVSREAHASIKNSPRRFPRIFSIEGDIDCQWQTLSEGGERPNSYANSSLIRAHQLSVGSMSRRVFKLLLLAASCLVSPPPARAFGPAQSTRSFANIGAPCASSRFGTHQAPGRRDAITLKASIKQRLHFNATPPPLREKEPPKLILISGGPGTGKSTFGMSLALEQGILKCISTDTVRAVMRSYVPESISPPLHRSSYGEYYIILPTPPRPSHSLLDVDPYRKKKKNPPFATACTTRRSVSLPPPPSPPPCTRDETRRRAASSSEDGTDDPVKSWIETCKVLDSSVEGLVDDAIQRGVSLVLEGVSIRPSRKYIDRFVSAGGVACGVVLVVSDEERHKGLLLRRGLLTGNTEAEERKVANFDRVRKVQEEMIRSAKESGWVLIEQRVEPDPLDVVADELFKASACMVKDLLMDELEEDCVLPTTAAAGGGGSAMPFVNRLVRAEDLVRADKEHMDVAAEQSKEEIEI
jgi:2-phosphoglycerate kinase